MEQDRLLKALKAAASVFGSSGFHAATLEELEAATGLSREQIVEAFRDKENLFYAAIDARRDEQSTLAGSAAEDEPLLALLSRLKKANSNTKLRAVHRDAFSRLMALLQESSEQDGKGGG